MASSISDRPKKRGRPATGRDPYVGFRSPPHLTEAIEAASAEQDDAPSRSEMIRRMVADWLTVHGFLKRTEKHPSPVGPATDAIDLMEGHITKDRTKRKR